MGKAFSDKERAEVQEKLRRTGLRLFAEKGVKGVSIRELTAAAGIAQGGFYTFYQDKTDFITDLIELRVREKLAAMAETRDKSLGDPVGYLSEQFYTGGMRLKNNKAFDNSVSGTLELFLAFDEQAAGRIKKHYRDYLEMLTDYWRQNGFTVEADIDGLLALIRMCGVILSNASMIDENCYPALYRTFCYAEVAALVKAAK